MKLPEIAARLEAISVEVEALSDVALEAGDNSEETLAQIEALDAEFSDLKAKQERQEKIQARVDEIVASRVAPSAPAVEPEASIEPELNETPEMENKIPAAAQYNKSGVFASSNDAYTAGKFLLATAGDRRAADFMAAQSEGVDSEGGFTVPTPLASELINLIEEYGVARNVCRRIVMG
ncbi:MAG: phage major capsid protein, partial [Hyphomicrobium sp.]|nr:phage major capsid protein [Hyphomicrobium sp.]